MLWWQDRYLALICIQIAATVISCYILSRSRQNQQLLHISVPPVRNTGCQGSDVGVSCRLRAERAGGRLLSVFFFHLQTRSNGLWGQPSLHLNGYRVSVWAEDSVVGAWRWPVISIYQEAETERHCASACTLWLHGLSGENTAPQQFVIDKSYLPEGVVMWMLGNAYCK